MRDSFILTGDICYSASPAELICVPGGKLICVNGISKGVFSEIPHQYESLPVINHSGRLIIPGLVDLHLHAPQYAFRALGMDLELLEWLETHTFREESKYSDLDYARGAYKNFTERLRRGPNTRACVFATSHIPATVLLMDLLEESGLVTMAGKVNMDRNCPDSIREDSARASLEDSIRWLDLIKGRYKNTYPILTPRFIPSCSDELMSGLGAIQKQFGLPVQSHLSENVSEVKWVKELCPGVESYGHAYAQFGLFGGDAPTIMAHCVYSDPHESALLRDRGVFVAHCPQSNANLSSGIAPVRRFLEMGINTGLGSDVAAGCHTSILRAMSDAIMVSKLRYKLVEPKETPLKLEEAFWLGTAGGGAFFGKTGGFASGFELDAVVIKDDAFNPGLCLSIPERLARVIYLSDDRHIVEKYVRGREILNRDFVEKQ